MHVADFLRWQAPNLLWWHTPNGGNRYRFEAARLKAQGVLAGVFDFQFVFDDGQVAFMELKIKPNKLTPEQEKFEAQLANRGIRSAVCYSLDEAIATLKKWEAIPRRVFR